MAYSSPLPYLQLLTLLLFASRALAFGRDVYSKYPRYSEFYGRDQASNLAGNNPRQRVSSKAIFDGIQTVLSLTQQVLDRLNTTGSQLDTIEELLAQQTGGESISLVFQPYWPFISQRPNDSPEYTEESDELDYIWPKEPQPDDPSPEKSPEDQFIDLDPITRLAESQSPISSLNYILPSSWVKLPISRSRQPPFDSDRIPPIWPLLRSALPHPLDQARRGWYGRIPPGRFPSPLPYPKKGHSYLTRRLSVNPKLLVPDNNVWNSYDMLHRAEFKDRSRGHPWGRWSRQLFNNDKSPPPVNPYINQSPPEDILHQRPSIPGPKQPPNRFPGSMQFRD